MKHILISLLFIFSSLFCIGQIDILWDDDPGVIYNGQTINIVKDYAGFDVYMHNLHRKLVNAKYKSDFSYTNQLVDTLCLAKALKKRIKLNKDDDFLAWQYRLNHLIERGLACNLKQCCKDFDVPFDEKKLHDALYDIEVNFEVFKY